jgi:hypothetical protein
LRDSPSLALGFRRIRGGFPDFFGLLEQHSIPLSGDRRSRDFRRIAISPRATSRNQHSPEGAPLQELTPIEEPISHHDESQIEEPSTSNNESRHPAHRRVQGIACKWMDRLRTIHSEQSDSARLTEQVV